MGKLSQWVKECIEYCRTRGELNASNNGQVLIEKFANKMDEGYEGNVTIPAGGKLIVEKGAEVEGLSTGGSTADDVFRVNFTGSIDSVVCDKTYGEIKEAYDAGKRIEAKTDMLSAYAPLYFNLENVMTTYILFSAVSVTLTSGKASGVKSYALVVRSSGVVGSSVKCSTTT